MNYITWKCKVSFRGHTGDFKSVAINPRNGVVISGSDDETIKLWNIEPVKCIRTIRIERPYDRMNIVGVTGLTEAQKTSLRTLGAVEHDFKTIV